MSFNPLFPSGIPVILLTLYWGTLKKICKEHLGVKKSWVTLWYVLEIFSSQNILKIEDSMSSEMNYPNNKNADNSIYQTNPSHAIHFFYLQ